MQLRVRDLTVGVDGRPGCGRGHAGIGGSERDVIWQIASPARSAR